jgi:hypothetical protein
MYMFHEEFSQEIYASIIKPLIAYTRPAMDFYAS